MITIKYVEGKVSRGLTVKGHANSNLPGKDLVCCSVSTLIQTLAYYLDSNNIANEQQIEPGDTLIYCDDEKAYVYFDFTVFGLEHLAKQFNAYIAFEHIKK